MGWVDRVALRVELPVIAAVILLLLRAIVMRLAQRLEVAALEREVWVLADRLDVIDHGGRGLEPDRETQAAPGLFGQHQRRALVAPPPEVVEPRHSMTHTTPVA
jgi:hypothetical protein